MHNILLQFRSKKDHDPLLDKWSSWCEWSLSLGHICFQGSCAENCLTDPKSLQQFLKVQLYIYPVEVNSNTLNSKDSKQIQNLLMVIIDQNVKHFNLHLFSLKKTFY